MNENTIKTIKELYYDKNMDRYVEESEITIDKMVFPVTLVFPKDVVFPKDGPTVDEIIRRAINGEALHK